MRNPWADEFERFHRTPACIRSAHGDCAHLMYGVGGGLNPRRLRLEVGAGVCKCECHSSCPVTSNRITVSAQAWRESCICPGAEAERIRHDQAGIEFPDFDELRARSRQEHQSSREAFQAVRARAAGKSREEVKALYIAELRSRDLDIPQGEVLDALVEALTGNHVRLIGLSVSGLWKLFRAVRRPR